MIKKVFYGSVNGKDYSNKEDYLAAINNALEDDGKVNASSYFKEEEVTEPPKIESKDSSDKELVAKNKEISRFTDNLKKFNDMFEKEFDTESRFFNKLFSRDFIKQFNSLF